MPENTDKFILTRVSRSSNITPMMLWTSTYEKLDAIKKESGLPFTAILDAMVTFCAKRMVIEGEDA